MVADNEREVYCDLLAQNSKRDKRGALRAIKENKQRKITTTLIQFHETGAAAEKSEENHSYVKLYIS